MLVAGIKSRPVYSGLNIDSQAKRHLFALEGEGALALLDQVKADEALNVVMGCNDHLYDPAVHRIVTAASCTTPSCNHSDLAPMAMASSRSVASIR